MISLDVYSEWTQSATVAEETGESPLVKATLIPAAKGRSKGENGRTKGYQARLAAGREPRKVKAPCRIL